MTYRSDSDALEARLDVLEKDLADRTRERDEVAHMLAEARATDAARRWLDGRPRRRRRWIIVAATLAVLGAFAAFLAIRHESRRDRDERILREFSAFTEEACKCTDKACADAVSQKMTRWGEALAKEMDTHEKPDEEMMKRFSPIVERYAKCLTNAMKADDSILEQANPGSASR